jgi:hypothetical protein
VKLLQLIGNSELDCGSKNVLRVMLTWADVSGGTMRLWPAIATVAHHLDMSEVGTRNIIKRLLQAGVLHVVKQSTGRKPTIYRIDVERLASLAAPPTLKLVAGCGTPTRNDVEGSTLNQEMGTRNHAVPLHDFKPLNPQRRYPEPSIHPSNQPTREPPASGAGGAPDVGDSDGMRIRANEEALRAAGVLGVNRRRLSTAPGVTAEQIQVLWAQVQADTSVNDPAAVLAARLSDMYRVPLRSNASVGHEAMRQFSELDAIVKMRRKQEGIDCE